MSDVDQAEQPSWLRAADFPLIALLLAMLLYAVATTLGHFVSLLVPPLGQPADAAVHMAIMLAFVLSVYKLVISRLGETPHDDLRMARALPELGKGMAAGAALFFLVAAIAAAAGVYRIAGLGDAANIVLPLISASMMPAIMEELLFRGILFRWLEEFSGSWAALIVTSALFGLAHSQNPGATLFSTFAIAVEGGLLLGGSYMLTRSLWMPIGLHAAWNLTQGPILGVPVSGNQVHGLVRANLEGPAILSGGAFGLEASIIAIAVCAAAGIWFLWLAFRRGEVVQPWWARRPRLNASLSEQ
ncbi:MAG: CPBP family intramembrane glutamic endopeptidase [Pseudomonadota bacterium]